MRFRPFLFNIILPLLAAGVFAGCETPKKKGEAKTPKATKDNISTIRFHLEAHPSDGDRTMMAKVGRTRPMQMVLMASPMITEANVLKAEAWNTTDGLVAIRLELDRIGRRILMINSGSQRGGRMAVSSHFPEPHWIGVVRFDRVMSEGVITFIPDATPEESDRIVEGLSIVAAKLAKDRDEDDF